MKNILQFKDKESLKDYLDKLTEEGLIKEFNACDNLYSKLLHMSSNIEEDIDVDFRLKIIDDHYNKLINNEKEYIKNKLLELRKYLEKVDNDLSQIIEYYNYNELMVNSLSHMIKYKNKSYQEAIIIIYDRLINEYHDGLFDRLKRMSYRMKKYIEMKIETLSKGLFIDDFFMGYYQNETDEMINMLTKTLEYELGEIIDFNNFFKEKLSTEHYQILKQTNCINKLGLFKRPTIVGCDLHDVVWMFEDCQIVRIENGNEIYNFNDCESMDFKSAIKIYFYSNYDDLNIRDIEEKNRDFREKYSIDDLFFGCYKGDFKDLVIFLK